MNLTEANKDMKEIIYKMIDDHLLYSCSVKTLEMWRLRAGNSSGVSPKEKHNMELRRKVLKYIRNQQSDLAFSILHEENAFDVRQEDDRQLFVLFCKLVFVDFVWNNRIEEAILFAKEHLEKKKDFGKLYTLIGYNEIDNEIVEKVCKEIDRSSIITRINSFLFSKVSGRKCSFLHSAIDYYKTLVNIQN